MTIGTSGPLGKGTKLATLGVRRSKVNVTRGPKGEGIILDSWVEQGF